MQRMQGAVQRVGHVEVFALLAQVVGAQPHGEERALELVHHLGQRIARGELALARILRAVVRIAPLAPGRAQRLRDLFNVEKGHGV